MDRPCEIIERYGTTGQYKVGLPNGAEDVHLEDMKPYLASVDGKAIPCCYFKPKPKIPHSDTYVVDKILEHRIKNGRHKWKVRWRGYGEEGDTWEPASSFIDYVQQDWKLWNKQHGVDFSVLNL